MRKAVIFDFDGTVADTFPFVENIVNSLAEKYGYKQFTHEEFIDLRSLSLSEIVEKYQISKINLLRMTLDGHRSIGSNIDKVKAFAGIKELIKELRERKVQVAIISTNSKKNIYTFLKNNGIVVDSVITSVFPFAKSGLVKRYLINKHLFPRDVVYVGDEVRDIETAKGAGVDCISVSWGYNTGSALQAKNEQAVSKVAELSRILFDN